MGVEQRTPHTMDTVYRLWQNLWWAGALPCVTALLGVASVAFIFMRLDGDSEEEELRKRRGDMLTTANMRLTAYKVGLEERERRDRLRKRTKTLNQELQNGQALAASCTKDTTTKRPSRVSFAK